MTRFTSIYAILLTVILTIVCQQPVTASQLTEQADSAYTAGQYDRVIELYNRAAATEGTSATLYYNLGNAHYRQKHPGLAILNYERALRLDPTMEEARANLDFVNSRIIDRPGERGTFIGNATDSIAKSAHPDTWAIMALAFFALAASGLMLYMFADSVTLRKTGFFGGLLMLIASIVSLLISLRAADISESTSEAVITVPSTILSTSPRHPAGRTEEAMLLHEGTKVEIIDSVRNPSDSTTWLDVRIDNAHRAWIDAGAVERVIMPQ